MDALELGGELSLTLVQAPIGYGKTMLVAAWCAERAERGPGGVAWLSLESSENDPALLTRYLIGALRRGGADVGQRAEAMLRVAGAKPLAWMGPLVNDLASLRERVTLVLDDYHLVVDAACHAMVRFLVDHAPSLLHVIICTRADPEILLGPLRAAGQLAEIRAADLRFSVVEAEQLLVGREGLELDREDVATLAARTEGWAAGLYLAAMGLRGSGEQKTRVEVFAGDNRHIVDYLSEVILDRLDVDVREFLLSTSVAERLCTSLCEAITGRAAAGMLERIERSNLFLVPLDDSRTWYRYHHLFGEMLRSELSRRHPDQVAELHRRASAWHRSAGLVSGAIVHATAAGDFDLAADLISEHWLSVGRWGQEATVRGWLAGFGEHELGRYPELGFIGGVIVGVSGGTDAEYRRWLELAERPKRDASGDGARVIAGATSLPAGVNFLRSTFGYRDIGAALAGAARAVRTESEADGEFRVVALANLAFLHYLAGDPTNARRAAGEALRDPQARRRPHGYTTALATTALISLDEGATRDGERTAQRALDYAAAAGLDENLVCGLAHVALGRALATAQRIKPAAENMQIGVGLLRGGVTPAWHAYALLWAAPVIQTRGDHASALSMVEEAEGVLASFEDAGILRSRLQDVQRRIALARPRRREPDLEALTEAERAVLRALRLPQSQRAIARELSISINTVKTHASSIYRKLGVSSRDEAVTRAISLGIL